MLKYLWQKLREAWPPNRVVVTLTPVVFVPLAGFIASWVAAHFPGIPPLDPGWLAGIFVAGALSALTAAYKWIDGWQKYEAQIANPQQAPVLAPEHRKRPPRVKEGGQQLPPGDGPAEQRPPDLDDEAALSLPDDIAESDADDPDAPPRRERTVLDEPQ